jgi:putative FmdB family regulatory protein
MPIYAYKCAACGHAADALQKMSDPALTVCPACGAEAYSKQLTAPQFQLKGSGWYVTDFRSGNAGAKDGKDAKDAKDAKEAKQGEPVKKDVAATESAAPSSDAASAKPAADSAAKPASTSTPAPATPAPAAPTTAA